MDTMSSFLFFDWWGFLDMKLHNILEAGIVELPTPASRKEEKILDWGQ